MWHIKHPDPPLPPPTRPQGQQKGRGQRSEPIIVLLLFGKALQTLYV